jgi:hypothetical protein
MPAADPSPVPDASTVEFSFRPFEIRTLRLTRATGTLA